MNVAMPTGSRGRTIVLVSILGALAIAAIPLAQRMGNHTVNSVRVAGEFRHVSRSALEQVVADQITKGFF